MNLIKLQIFFLIIFSMMLLSCQDEFLSGNKTVEEGIPTTITLNVSANNNKVVTRAAQSEETEKAIYNLYVFVFDANDNVITRHYIKKNENENVVIDQNITIETVSMNSAKIYGIANVTSDNNATSYIVNQQTLDNISSLKELENLTVSLAVNAINRGSSFLMSGFATDGTDNVIQIPPTSGTNISLNLRRMDAKVTFNIKAENPSLKDFSFRPMEWKVCQLPKKTLLVEKTQGDFDTDGGAGDDSYFSTGTYSFEIIENQDTSKDLYTGSFTFYMPENRKSPKQTIPTNNDEGGYLTTEKQYKLREKRDEGTTVDDPTNKPGQQFIPEDFTYANKYSTYVVLTGWLSYKQEINGIEYQVNTLANYIIHLGGTGEKKNDGSNKYEIDANNYDTDRNTNYTYNVTVSGIEDLKVEVELDNEVRPGHEGTVIVNEKQFFEFDAHYCRGYLEISKEDLLKLAGEDDYLTWGVKTPFSSGMHKAISGNEVPKELSDYKWVKFALNKDYNVGRGQYLQYPGDQNYKGDGSDVSDYKYNKPAPLYTDFPDARLLDINQLCIRLKEEAQILSSTGSSTIFDGDYAPITIFLDEYVYYYDPVKYDPYLYKNRYNNPDLLLWKYFLNAADREMNVSLGETQYSPDGNSTITNSVFAGYQKSIKTVYNLDYDGTYGPLKRPWGMENTLEPVADPTEANGNGILLPINNKTYYGNISFTDKNGRPNTLNLANGGYMYNGKAWQTYINRTYGASFLLSGYQNILYALLTRNRDSNGDGVLQEEEIKWYLASQEQLVDLFLGQPALNEENYLYPERAEDRPGRTDIRWHYLTSSCDYNEPYGTPYNRVILAEEGASISNYSNSHNVFGDNYAYRFLRNLGVLPENDCIGPGTNWPDELITVTSDGSGGFNFEVERLNTKALREYVLGALPEHNEDDYNNRLYKSFKLDAYSNDKWGGTWESCKNSEYNLGQFRLPNQRELLVITTRMPAAGWWNRNYMCKTGFSKAGTGHFGSGQKTFRLNSDTKELHIINNASDGGYMRGVRDVK